jgi:hypothetical protein
MTSETLDALSNDAARKPRKTRRRDIGPGNPT